MNDLIKKALSEQLPFILYRKPNEESYYGWFHKVAELTKSCFVFAPFNSNEKIVFYPEDCKLIKNKIDFSVDFSEDELVLEALNDNKSFHIQLVAKGIEAIKTNYFQKVVLSRKEEIFIDSDKYELYFQRFLKKYPTAFVYWFYHPKVGMWMGATPEQLLKINDNTVETVALAGTMIDSGMNIKDIMWGEKEREEQQIVTDFIVDHLKYFSKNIDQTKPYTHRAGSLFHLKTDIKAELINSENAFQVVESLHPTPALCGFPKEAARDFIIKNEGYDREYYGGYLGEWKFNDLDYSNKSDLFVNLRCMKIVDDKAYLFLGGGINKDSNPESEYLETVNKSKTVKSIL